MTLADMEKDIKKLKGQSLTLAKVSANLSTLADDANERIYKNDQRIRELDKRIAEQDATIQKILGAKK